jgi:hypothetical protein
LSRALGVNDDGLLRGVAPADGTQGRTKNHIGGN